MASQWMIDRIKSGTTAQGAVPSLPSFGDRKSLPPSPVQQVKSPVVPSPTPLEKTMSGIGDAANKITSNKVYQTLDAPRRIMTAGMGKFGEILSAPGRFVESKLTGGKGYEDLFANTDFGKKVTKVASNKVVQGVLPPAAAFSNPKTAAIASSLALDPLNLVGAGVVSKASKATKIPTLATKIISKVNKTKAAPYIEKARDIVGKFQYGYKMAPRTMKKYEQLQAESQNAIEYAKKVASPLFYGADGKELPQTTQKVIGNIMGIMSGNKPTQAMTKADEVLYQKYKPVVEKVFKEFSKLAQEQVRAGADPKIFENLLGKYGGQRIFTSTFEGPRLASKGTSLSTGIYNKRKVISEEARKALGEIIEPAYGAATAAYKEKRNVSVMKFLKEIAKKEAISKQGHSQLDAVKKAAYSLVPNDSKYGVLAGSYVPKQTFEYIRPLLEPSAEGIKKTAETATKLFKAGKTVLSPKQLGRNVLTSQIQAFLENPMSVAYLPQAIKEKVTGGKFYKALKETGEIAQSMPSQELATYLPDDLSKLSQRNLGQKIFSGIKKPGSIIQSGTEEVSKLQSFMARLYDEAGKARIPIDEALKRKDLIEKARKAAETSQFNYQRVSPTVAKLRKGLVPFITYPTKALGLTAKVLKEHPERYTALMKGEKAIQESFKEPVNEEYLPDYLKEAVRVGNPDKKGTTPYVNTKYFYPHGNLQEMNPLPFGLGLNPIITELAQQAFDQDLLTKKKVSETGRVRHAVETFAPSFVRSGWQFYDAATKNPKSATSGTPKDVAIKETGLPYYKYNPQQGRSIQAWERSEKVSAIRKQMRQYIKDYTGKKSQEEINKKLQEFYKKIQEISRQ